MSNITGEIDEITPVESDTTNLSDHSIDDETTTQEVIEILQDLDELLKHYLVESENTTNE